MRRVAFLGLLAVWSGSCLLADFSYEQTSKLTGGMMAGMMKVMGAFSKQLREPMRSSVLVKGDRMAQTSSMNAHIIDLNKETITEINFQKKTYSVITFAEMAQAMKQLEAKLANEKGEQQGDISIKTSVKETGQRRQVSGLDTREMLVTMEMEGTDKKTGQKGTFMVITADVWVAPQMAGYDEVRNFYQRMAQKLNWMPGMNMFAQGRADASKGMAEAYKEMAKLSGVPVLQVTRMGAKIEGQPQPGAGGQQAAQQQPPPPQQQQAEAERPSAGSALGRLGGRFGGLGGLARRKKQEQQEQPQPQAPPAQTAQAAPQGSPEAAGTLMEITTELTGFSSAPVDASKFEVPAGFKQVESDTLKSMRR